MGRCGPNCICEDDMDLGESGVITKETSQEEGWHTCLKQVTRCVIETPSVWANGTPEPKRGMRIEGTNACHVEDATVCPRVTAGCVTGEGYDLCGPPKHAEQEAAKLLLKEYPEGAPYDSVAYLYGHYYLCADCQVALTDAGVRTFVVTGEPA